MVATSCFSPVFICPPPIPVNDRHLWSPQNDQKPSAFSMNLFISYFQELPLFALALENLCLMFSLPFRMFSIMLPPVSSRFHYSVCAYPSVILPSCNGLSCQRNSMDIFVCSLRFTQDHNSINYISMYDHASQVLSESNSRNATTFLAVFSPLSSTRKPSSAQSSSSSSTSVVCDSSILSPLLRPLATLAITSP